MVNEPWSIYSYRDERRRAPVEDFIATLDEQLRAKTMRTLGLLRQFGDRLGMPSAAPIPGYRFWELRIQASGNIARIFYFAASGRTMVLLHGYIKKTAKAPRSDLAVAARRMEEYLSRKR